MTHPADLLEEVARLVADALPPGRAMPDVLEVGCGDGAFAERFTAAHPHVAYLATDPSGAAVEATRARGVTAQLMDATALLAGPASYDVAVALGTLDHGPDAEAAVAELRRVLRPGGGLVVTTTRPDVAESVLTATFGRVTRVEHGVVTTMLAAP